MKKFFCIMFLILILPAISLIILYKPMEQYYPKSADSGFDYDYGDYDSGGSWDNDYDDDYDGGSWGGSYNSSDRNKGTYSGGSGNLSPSDLLDILGFILGAILICVSPLFFNLYIPYAKKRNQKRRDTLYRINTVLANDYYLQQGDGLKDEVVKYAYLTYVEIQKAWMNRNLAPVRHLLTDEIYNMYQMQIETLIEDNQVNVMSDFKFICGKLNSVTTNKNMETLKVILCVKCKDYIKDIKNNFVVNGDKRATITYVYELTFVRDKTANKPINCPTCGALVEQQMSTNCSHCKNSLLLTSSNLTMTNKVILEHFKYN